MKNQLLTRLHKVQQLAEGSKWKRLLHHPYKYIHAILLRDYFYKKNLKEEAQETVIFTGDKMHILLPSATDLYLVGGKSHPSEIRLAQYLIKNLDAGDTFWDIGAHYGYFTMIASKLVSVNGQILSVEAAPATLDILLKNTKNNKQVTVQHRAISDTLTTITFHELPNLYSEYNTTDVTQFEQEDWYKKIQVKKIEVPTTTLDHMYSESGMAPKIIKMDVEGGEAAAVKGGEKIFSSQDFSPILIMEYLEPKRSNQPHIAATQLMRQWGYSTHIITDNGELESIDDIDAYLIKNSLESDNIVFVKEKSQ